MHFQLDGLDSIENLDGLNGLDNLDDLDGLDNLDALIALITLMTLMTLMTFLGREGSKGIQLAVATYHLLINCSYLSWQMSTATSVEQAMGVNPYTRPFFIVCNIVLACGPISYLLAVYQLLLMDI